jgi:hypothetical protein
VNVTELSGGSVKTRILGAAVAIAAVLGGSLIASPAQATDGFDTARVYYKGDPGSGGYVRADTDSLSQTGAVPTADGTRGPVQTTWGLITAEVTTGSDWVQVTFTVRDNRCDRRGFVAGVRAYAEGASGDDYLHRETITNAQGCGSVTIGTRRFTASELKGHSSGYLVVSYGPRINGIDYPWESKWFSTLYSI